MPGKDIESASDTSRKNLRKIEAESNLKIGSKEFARLIDGTDPIKHLKNEFIFPMKEDPAGTREKYIYFATNKVGLQPKRTKRLVLEVLENWALNALNCHVMEPLPTRTCEEYVVDQLGKLVGAHTGEEIVAMNDVNVNLHIPYEPNKDILKFTDIARVIEEEGESIAIILLPGLLTRSGQLLDIEKITQIGHKKRCMVGFVLDDVVGNVELRLSDWGVDFACWDAGKFLNAGHCAVGCAFLHHKHARNDLPKLTGWWAHRLATRFEMTNCLERSPGVNGYKISHESPIKIAQMKSSLDIFDQTSIGTLRAKSILLIGYLENLLKDKLPNIVLTTPSNPTERGAQLSVKSSKDVKQIYERLKENGIICSYALPDIITFCPAPLYCTFIDVFMVAEVFTKVIS